MRTISYWRYRCECKFRLLEREGSDLHHFVFKKGWPDSAGRGSTTIIARIVGLARGAPSELKRHIGEDRLINLYIKIIPVDPERLWRGWKGVA